MEASHKKVIKDHLDILVDNTTNLDDLVFLLITKGLLSEPEQQNLDSRTNNNRKLAELYLLMLKKGPTAYEKLIAALETTGNSYSAELLAGYFVPSLHPPASTMIKSQDRTCKIGTPNVFISYRRKGGSDIARLIRERLQQNNRCDVFFDMETLTSGPYPKQIQKRLDDSTHFVLVLNEGSLDRCFGDSNGEDWIHLEVAQALKNPNAVVIPVVTQDFEWPNTDKLPEDMRSLGENNQVTWSQEFNEASLAKLEKFIFGETFVSETKSKVDAEEHVDFPLEDKQVHLVSNLITESARIYEKWPMVVRNLLVPRDRADLNSPIAPVDLWVSKTLDRWIGSNGSRATFDGLLNCLQNNGLVDASQNLQRRRSEVAMLPKFVELIN